MKALILAAGYATRLYPLTKDTPKPLLKINKRPIIDYIVDKVTEISEVKQIYVVSNQRFYDQFEDWLYSKKNGHSKMIKLIKDNSTTVENRIGAIGDMRLAIEKESIDDDLLVVAGDNIFDFDLRQFVDFSASKRPHNSICLYLPGANHIDYTRFGIAQLNSDYVITNFEEKPDLPKSNLIATCIYFFTKEKLSLILKYLSWGNHNDAPGSYINWLTRNDKVYGHICDGIWFDLGDFESLSQALIHFNGNGISEAKYLHQ